jgi:hypothetical protein
MSAQPPAIPHVNVGSRALIELQTMRRSTLTMVPSRFLHLIPSQMTFLQHRKLSHFTPKSETETETRLGIIGSLPWRLEQNEWDRFKTVKRGS